MNKFFRLCLAPLIAAAVVCAMPLCHSGLTLKKVYAAEVTGDCGDNLKYTISDDGTLTISGSGDMYDYSWETSPFYKQKDNIKKLVLNEGINRIGNLAFQGCNGITGELNIPESVTEIGEYAFADCTGFNGSLVIPSKVTAISTDAFGGCYGFNGTLTIPESVTSIGFEAFLGCGFTGKLTIPETVTEIGGYAFSGCSGFTGNLAIPQSVTKIDDYAFSGCTGLTGGIIIPDSTAVNIASAFSGCTELTVLNQSDVKQTDKCGENLNYFINNDETVIIITGTGEMYNYSWETSPFYAQKDIKKLVLNEGINRIGNFAFQGCSGITCELNIPESVTEIGEYAFTDCTGFTGSLVIPSKVTAINKEAFGGCSGFNGTLTIPESVTSIGFEAFIDCGFTGKLTIPETVTEIGEYAFSGCSGFTGSLIIPSSVTSIGQKAFYSCSGLDNITVLNKKAAIDTGAFDNTKKLRYFIGSTASDYTQGSGTAPEMVPIQDQSGTEISIAKPTNGKWIQRVELTITKDGTPKTVELTKYKEESGNYIFPVLMYANSYIGGERSLPYQVCYYYNYEDKAADEAALNSASPASEDKSSGSPADTAKVYYDIISSGNTEFYISEEVVTANEG